MSEQLNRNPVQIPSGHREKYNALTRELFWDIKDRSLFLRMPNDGFDKSWVLIGGDGKQNPMVAGDNLEINYREDDPKHWFNAELRLIDDIDVNTMELGKFAAPDVRRWKGTIKLGEIRNCTFFPVTLFFDPFPSKATIGGKFLIKITRGDIIEWGVYQATITSSGRGVIFGSDTLDTKCTIDKITLKDGNRYLGFKTHQTEEWDNGVKVPVSPDKFEVWFNGWDTRTKDMLPPYDFTDKDFTSIRVIARG